MSKRPKGLGAGFDALFENEELGVIDEITSGAKQRTQTTLPLSAIEPNPDQPRVHFDKEALEELADSIMSNGILSPLIVRPQGGGMYMIIAGERRWRAARMAGLLEVPVVIREADDKTAAQLSLIENLQRQDLNPIEEAKGYLSLSREYNLTQEEISKSVGKSRPAIANALRLLALPGDVIEYVRDGKLSAGHAKVLVALGDKSSEVARQVIKNDLSVRQTEVLAKAFAGREDKRPKEKTDTAIYIEQLERDISSSLGRRVRITHGKKKGKIELEYYGNDDFESLMTFLMSLMDKTDK